jgi:benzil reductase ((S)-benzoin forming)
VANQETFVMHYYFITGTSFGLGKAIAEALLQREDVFVYGISRTSSISHNHYKHVFADLSNPAQLSPIIELFEASFTNQDSLSLINNAGVIDPIKYLGDFTAEDILQLMHVNLISPIQLMNIFLKIPQGVKRKIVINVSSGAASKITDGWSLYGSSKAALDHASLHAAKEIELNGTANIHIFSVAPGVIDTHMQAKIRAVSKHSFSMVDRFIDLHETNALDTPEQVAQKYLKILDAPQEFPKVVFSAREI